VNQKRGNGTAKSEIYTIKLHIYSRL